jgi:hypothetical protein
MAKTRNEIHNSGSIDGLGAETKDKLGHPD